VRAIEGRIDDIAATRDDARRRADRRAFRQDQRRRYRARDARDRGRRQSRQPDQPVRGIADQPRRGRGARAGDAHQQRDRLHGRAHRGCGTRHRNAHDQRGDFLANRIAAFRTRSKHVQISADYTTERVENSPWTSRPARMPPRNSPRPRSSASLTRSGRARHGGRVRRHDGG